MGVKSLEFWGVLAQSTSKTPHDFPGFLCPAWRFPVEAALDEGFPQPELQGKNLQIPIFE